MPSTDKIHISSESTNGIAIFLNKTPHLEGLVHRKYYCKTSADINIMKGKKNEEKHFMRNVSIQCTWYGGQSYLFKESDCIANSFV